MDVAAVGDSVDDTRVWSFVEEDAMVTFYRAPHPAKLERPKLAKTTGQDL